MGPLNATGARTDALRWSLEESQQEDTSDLTRFDEIRCGAATTVAAALLRGEPGAHALINGLRAPRLPSARDAVRRSLLDDAVRELATAHTLTGLTVQRLQDLMYEVSQLDDVPGTSGLEQDHQIRIAGLPTRQAPHDVRVADALDSEQSEPYRARLDRHLAPGEAVPLFLQSVLQNDASDNGHIVLYARDRNGVSFMYDALLTPALVFANDTAGEALIAKAFARTNGMQGHAIIDISQ